VKNQLITIVMFAGVLASGGCATKKYVAKTVDPVRDKVDTVSSTTDKQGQQIAQQGTQLNQTGEDLKNQISKEGTDIDQARTDINANKERAMAADARAGDALQRAGDALQKADKNTKDLGELRQVVANLDDYKPAGNTAIPFAFNRDVLTAESKADLDKLVDGTGTMKRYFIAVEGFTDKTGSVSYNNQLSRRRAEAVMLYLVAKHDIPLYRIHMIGLGMEKPADTNNDRAARAKNRRVEVTIYSAENPGSAMATSTTK
jgi:outer membrane protein OmpA-like peptidoglycan-associated protein